MFPTFFADYFSSIYKPDLGQTKHNFEPHRADGSGGGPLISLKGFTRSEVRRALRDLMPKSSYGPDLVPPYIFRDCSKFLVAPLTFLCNLVLGTATFPDIWKNSKVIPFHKSGRINEIMGCP